MKEKKDKPLADWVRNVFEESYIESVLSLYYELLEYFFLNEDLEGRAYINPIIADQCFNDIITDLARLCLYHDIDQANEYKIYTYMASWALRRQPFQLIPKDDENDNEQEDQFINERFAFGLLLKETGLLGKTTEGCKESVVKTSESIYYHIKYRNTNPKALLLLINGISVGQMCSLSK